MQYSIQCGVFNTDNIYANKLRPVSNVELLMYQRIRNNRSDNELGISADYILFLMRSENEERDVWNRPKKPMNGENRHRLDRKISGHERSKSNQSHLIHKLKYFTCQKHYICLVISIEYNNLIHWKIINSQTNCHCHRQCLMTAHSANRYLSLTV
jgi:hypothetical protein